MGRHKRHRKRTLRQYQYQGVTAFGELLRAVRLGLNLSQMELGEAINYCGTEICRLERGHNLPRDASYLSTGVYQLITGKMVEIAELKKTINDKMTLLKMIDVIEEDKKGKYYSDKGIEKSYNNVMQNKEEQ